MAEPRKISCFSSFDPKLYAWFLRSGPLGSDRSSIRLSCLFKKIALIQATHGMLERADGWSPEMPTHPWPNNGSMLKASLVRER